MDSSHERAAVLCNAVSETHVVGGSSIIQYSCGRYNSKLRETLYEDRIVLIVHHGEFIGLDALESEIVIYMHHCTRAL